MVGLFVSATVLTVAVAGAVIYSAYPYRGNARAGWAAYRFEMGMRRSRPVTADPLADMEERWNAATAAALDDVDPLVASGASERARDW